MYMCEECNYVWDVQRSIGDPEVRQCPKCLSYEIEETSPSNVPQGQANDRERSAYVQLSDVRELLSFVDWILTSKIPLCDKRCLMQDVGTSFGKVKSNQCDRESCPELVLKLLADNVRAHF